MAARVHAVRDAGLGNTTYVVEVARGLAVSVDPPRDADRHRAVAEENGLRIVAALETHVHADYATGAPELAGATVYAAAAAGVAYPHTGVEPEQTLDIGDRRFRVLATPGHTPDHVAFVLEDDDGPEAVFSGGSLIAGGAARTDLVSDEVTEELTRLQFRSIRRVVALGDDVALRPTHGAGSFCSAGGGGRKPTTIGDERGRNPLLDIDDEDAFVREFLGGLGSYPTYFASLPAFNRAGPPSLASLPAPKALSPRAANVAIERGAVAIDGRPIGAWTEGHARGAASIEVRPEFASWLGWVVPFGSEIVLVDGDIGEAVRQARLIGYDRVLGWVDGGAAAWRDEGLPWSEAPFVEPDAAAGATFVDVRQRSEWDEGHVPGATHVELGALARGDGPTSGRAIVYCAHGQRSATGASILEARGLDVQVLRGGFEGWREAGQPVER